MQKVKWSKSWLLISSPLLLNLLGACDSQNPAFVERTTGITSMDNLPGEYSGEAIPNTDGEGEIGESSTEGISSSNAYDPARDDETAADRGEPTDGPAVAVAKWSFSASKLENGSLALDTGFGEVQLSGTMENNLATTRLNFVQVNRPVVTEAFRQGSSQVNKIEHFQQESSARGMLDILVVIDTSQSMKEEQTNLSTKMMPLLSYVQNADWKIGVVTTDPAAGCLRGLIKKGDPQASAHFSQAINAGIDGSGNERGILQAVNGLKGECNAEGSWLRSNSTVAVLIVSDEDNCSNGTGCGSEPWASSNYLIDYLASIRQVGTNARVYGLAWQPSRSQSACRTAYYKANIYADAISRTGGTMGSICDGDYTNTLQAISLDLSVLLNTQFALSFEPASSGLKVYVNDVLRTSGYQVRGNIIEFAEAPLAGSTIRVDYQTVTQTLKKEFALSNEADPATLSVYLDGTATRNFTYDAASHTVRFTQAPTAAEVKAVYRKDEALETEFLIQGTPKAGSIKVKVDGVLLASQQVSYVAQQNIVRLAQAPKDSAAIEISYSEELAPRLRYPLNVPAAKLAEVKVYDALNQRPINFSIDGRELVFAASEFRALRKYVVSYPASGEGAWTVDTGYPLLADSVKVTGTKSGSCSSIGISGTMLDLSACHFDNDEGINIEYAYAGDHKTSFDLGNLDLDLSRYSWSVTVNGQETKAFTVADGQLNFAELPYYSKVEVSLYKVR